MSVPDEVYVLSSVWGAPVVTHTTQQGAEEERARYPESHQKRMTVDCVKLVVD